MNKQPQNLEPVLPIEPHPPIVQPAPLQPILQQKTTAQIKIPTYRALPHTRRGVVCDFFREKVFNLPKDEPAPVIGGVTMEFKRFFIFEKHENGFDFEYLGAIDNPSPLCDRSEAEAAVQKYIKTQNEAWAKYWGFSPSDGQQAAGRSEPFLPLFDDFLELQDCYAVYHPNFEGYILYWQVNYRIMLPSVLLPPSDGQRGAKQYRAAVQGEYVRIGIYNDRAARTMQFRHFAVEEIGKEPYFFAPKTETQTAQGVINPPTPLAKTAKKTAVLSAVPTDTADIEDVLLQTHEALFFKKMGDGYAAFAATPQGEVAASKSGVREEVQEEVKDEKMKQDLVLFTANGGIIFMKSVDEKSKIEFCKLIESSFFPELSKMYKIKLGSETMENQKDSSGCYHRLVIYKEDHILDKDFDLKILRPLEETLVKEYNLFCFLFKTMFNYDMITANSKRNDTVSKSKVSNYTERKIFDRPIFIQPQINPPNLPFIDIFVSSTISIEQLKKSDALQNEYINSKYFILHYLAEQFFGQTEFCEDRPDQLCVHPFQKPIKDGRPCPFNVHSVSEGEQQSFGIFHIPVTV